MGDIATASALMGAVIYSLLNLVALLTAQQWLSAGKIVLSYLVGIFVLFVFAASTIGGGIVVYGTMLSALNTFDKIILGLVAPSLAGALYNIKQAIDGNDTAVMPKLGGGG